MTGGLFLGNDATTGENQLTGHFPDSQDQRHTIRGFLVRLNPRFWIAGGMQYDTGLPFEFDGDPSEVLAEYGQQVLNRINFARGRILSVLPDQCIGGRGCLQVRPHEYALSDRRAELDQRPRRNRLRRSFLRQRHRPSAELLPPVDDEFLATVCSRNERRVIMNFPAQGQAEIHIQRGPEAVAAGMECAGQRRANRASPARRGAIRIFERRNRSYHRFRRWDTSSIDCAVSKDLLCTKS